MGDRMVRLWVIVGVDIMINGYLSCDGSEGIGDAIRGVVGVNEIVRVLVEIVAGMVMVWWGDDNVVRVRMYGGDYKSGWKWSLCG